MMIQNVSEMTFAKAHARHRQTLITIAVCLHNGEELFVNVFMDSAPAVVSLEEAG